MQFLEKNRLYLYKQQIMIIVNIEFKVDNSNNQYYLYSVFMNSDFVKFRIYYTNARFDEFKLLY